MQNATISTEQYNEMVVSLIAGASVDGIHKSEFVTTIFFPDHSWASVAQDEITIYGKTNKIVGWFVISSAIDLNLWKM